MANRFPLIFNSGAGQIQELAASDNLDLTSSNLVNAGILFTSSGSQTAPSLQIGSGTTYNPGLYSPGTDQVAVATNGTSRLSIDSTGKILAGALTNINANSFQISIDSGASTSPYLALFNTASSPTSAASTRLDLGFLSGTANYNATNTVLGSINWMGQGNDAGYGGASIQALLTSGGNVGRSSGHSVDLIFNTKKSSVAGFEEKMRLTSGGLVGIGNSSPRGIIHVGADLSNGATDAAAINLKQTSTTAATGIYLERSAERKGYYIYLGGDNDSLNFQRNNNGTKADVMTLTRDGLVGIGSTGPVNKLDVNGSISASGAFSNTGFGPHVHIGLSGGNPCILSGNNVAATFLPLVFRQETVTGASEAMRIDSSGRLLVGTSSNSGGATCQVVGSVQASNTFRFPSNIKNGGTSKPIAIETISTDGGTNSANTYGNNRYGAGKYVVLAAFNPSGDAVAASNAVGNGSTFVYCITDAATNFPTT